VLVLHFHLLRPNPAQTSYKRSSGFFFIYPSHLHTRTSSCCSSGFFILLSVSHLLFRHRLIAFSPDELQALVWINLLLHCFPPLSRYRITPPFQLPLLIASKSLAIVSSQTSDKRSSGPHSNLCLPTSSFASTSLAILAQTSDKCSSGLPFLFSSFFSYPPF
jgi:hypothetical protein